MANYRNEQILAGLDLTRTQARVVIGLMRGLSNEEIATELGARAKTIKFHITNILKLTNCDSRYKFLVALARRGWDFSEQVTMAYTEPVKTFEGGLPRGVA